MAKISAELLQAIAVTAELTGTTFSEPAARVMAGDLAQFPEDQVMAALRRCRRELRSTLTLAAILERIDDGRPGSEESWARLSSAIGNERATVVVTAEELRAFYVADKSPDDKIAARMAFKEAYTKAVTEARAVSRPVGWTAILGHDPGEREAVLIEAVEQGKLTLSAIKPLLPYRATPDPRIRALTQNVTKQLN